MPKIYPDALPLGLSLHWYRIDAVLGQGGFGLTYLATDTNLKQQVAIKEYLPIEFATRMPDGSVAARSETMQERYRWGLERFVSEAQVLARFDHPNIVRVHSVFEHNNTAYMVMRYEDGENLEVSLRGGREFSERELLDLLMPVLDGLEAMHAQGFIHRDIKPDNIYVRSDGSPVLIDFGSARQAVGSSETLTILIAPGYAPFEQYSEDPGQQGPWTDIYGLGATLYRAVAGRPPIDAIARSRGVLGSTKDVLTRAVEAGHGRYSRPFLEAIDHALAFREDERPQSIGAWREDFGGLATSSAPLPAAKTTPDSDPSRVPTVIADEAASAPRATPAEPRGRSPGAVAMLLIAGLAAAAGYMGARIAAPPEQRADIDAAAPADTQLAAQATALEAQRRTLDDRSARIDTERRALEADRKALGARETALENERAALQTERDTARTERETLDARAAALTTREGELNARGDTLKRSERELAAREQIVQANEARNASLKKRLEDAESKLATLERNERELRKLRERVATLERAPRPAARAAAAPRATTRAPSTASSPASEPVAAVPPPPTLANATRALSAGDYTTARAELETLAGRGSAEARYRLGLLDLDGKGGPKNVARGLALLEQAGEAGVGAAQAHLGRLYARGGAVPRDDLLAYMWLAAAVARGEETARTLMDEVGARMQPMEVEQARELSLQYAR